MYEQTTKCGNNLCNFLLLLQEINLQQKCLSQPDKCVRSSSKDLQASQTGDGCVS